MTQYIPALSWHLIVERDTTVEQKEIQQEICIGAFIVILVIILVLYTINKIIHRYNNEVVRLAIEKEKKHSGVFQLETEKIYENIYEVDLTHNRVASEATEQYFKRRIRLLIRRCILLLKSRLRRNTEKAILIPSARKIY